MNLPTEEDVFALLDASWPAQEVHDCGPFVLRRSNGGGKRVTAATLPTRVPFTENQIADAETQLRAWGQTPLFMIRGDDPQLDAALETRGYNIVDPVIAYALDLSSIPTGTEVASAYVMWPPLQILCDIWVEGGIGPDRVAVMERVRTPKAALFARTGDEAAGTAFVAAANGIAMLHALEVLPPHRRKGVAQNLMHAALDWAREQGCRWLSVVVTRANDPARALYERLGMQPVAEYHYRMAT
ncbi:GNAT family N-acetyltransferase [Qingshengfaniella alkalisoli]|uniref:GNAT family N-acetyltransferase n=1 Tax=Qingshengfaniella alkalisoli TaxID=2599296 RepID=A0A5B8I9X2_9RHOB|nr:GNAT family N-acetyltransferase [Qingshengfaniella alkalisoli]QDY69916.1 GNAT family N-acetyltransferase [Qingshengfaniella alkalisoli]